MPRGDYRKREAKKPKKSLEKAPLPTPVIQPLAAPELVRRKRKEASLEEEEEGKG